nr:bromodomain-containing protein [Tanacetum cinerariifolium]
MQASQPQQNFSQPLSSSEEDEEDEEDEDEPDI